LAAVPTSLMLGVTSFVSTDISAIPLFWIVPLALYLLSFILVFARWPERLQETRTFAALGLGGVCALLLVMSYLMGSVFLSRLTFPAGLAARALLPHRGQLLVQPFLILALLLILFTQAVSPIWRSITISVLTFFSVAMVCHGELARDRPRNTHHLTEFYLWMS